MARPDKIAISADTQILLSVIDPSAHPLATKQYIAGSAGSEFQATTATEGWHTFTVRSQHTPAADPNPRYQLTVTYTAPRTMN